MLVQSIMHKPTFVDPDMTIEAVAEIMAFKNIGSVIVGTPKRSQGIFSERDILKKIVARGISPKIALVRDYMSSPLITISFEKTVIDAMRVMNERRIKRLPVVEGGEIIGMLSMRTVMESVERSIITNGAYVSGYGLREEMPSFW